MEPNKEPNFLASLLTPRKMKIYQQASDNQFFNLYVP